MEYTDLRVGKKVIFEGEPWLVTTYEFSRKQQRKAVVKCQLKNLMNGRVLHKTFQGSDELEPATLDVKKCEFLYKDGTGYYFMDTSNYDQFPLTEEQVGTAKNFIREGSAVEIAYFGDKPISIELPPKIELKIIDTPIGARGDTATGGSKQATLETGLVVLVPLFVNTGETVRINTETSEYVERVK